MISAKKLIQMARKWQKMAAASRKRLSWPRSMTDEGHFVVYTIEGKRFVIPLTCLNSEIFKELFRMTEEEFGIRSLGAIMLPCDSNFMEYVILMIQKSATADLEKAMITSLAGCRYSSGLYEHDAQMKQHVLISSF